MFLIPGIRIPPMADDKESERARRAALAVQGTDLEIYWFKPDGTLLDANQAACLATGYSEAELREITVFDLDPRCAPDRLHQALAKLTHGPVVVLETLHRRKDGSTYPVDVTLVCLDAKEELYCGFAKDVSERRLAHDQISMYKDILDFAGEAIFWVNEEGRIVYVNEAACTLLGYDRLDLLALNVRDLNIAMTPQIWRDHWMSMKIRRRAVFEICLRRADGHGINVEISSNFFVGPMGEVSVSFVRDVTERNENLRKIKETANLLGEIQKIADIGHYEADFINDIIRTSDSVHSMFGTPATPFTTLGRWLDLVHPEDREALRHMVVHEVIEHGRPFEAQYRIIRPSDGQVRWMYSRGEVLRDATGKPQRMIGPIQDITERKQAQDQIQQTVDALTRSNVELERFAYVASHDLQEPIRNIVAYSQLLAQRYRGRLDADADEFLGYIVGGAKRMHALVLDLLAYSRLSAAGQPFRMVNLGRVVNAVCDDLRMAIRDSGARITTGPLPLVYGDEIQLVALFQNLIGNAIKFRRPDTLPAIYVGAQREERAWVLEVIDNGIGMDPAFLDKIFVIFKRLHTAQAYPGTGIGLAVAKRIVERHGGAISVESTPGQGSRFCVTLPDPVT